MKPMPDSRYIAQKVAEERIRDAAPLMLETLHSTRATLVSTIRDLRAMGLDVIPLELSKRLAEIDAALIKAIG